MTSKNDCVSFVRYFRSEDSKESVRVIPVGNVTAETELTYEYGVRRQSRKKTDASGEMKGATPGVVTSDTPVVSGDLKVPPLMIGGKPHLPFQVQIEYTGRDGSRCMRVISDAKPITRDRGVAENGMCVSDDGHGLLLDCGQYSPSPPPSSSYLQCSFSPSLSIHSSYILFSLFTLLFLRLCPPYLLHSDHTHRYLYGRGRDTCGSRDSQTGH